MYVNEMPWSAPVAARLQCGACRVFTSVYEALDFLENEWPLRNGPKYRMAVGLCRLALDRKTPASVAREAFIAACYEAGLMPPAPPTFRAGLKNAVNSSS